MINTELSWHQKGNLRPGEGDGAGFGESEKADADADADAEEEEEEGDEEDADSGTKFSVAPGSAFPCPGAETIKMISI